MLFRSAILERSDPDNQFSFTAVWTAQDIGSYKPDLANLTYALNKLHDEFGIEKDEVLVVAASLAHDHVPANKLGVHCVYIDRVGKVMGYTDGASYDWRWATLGEMADAVQKEEKA